MSNICHNCVFHEKCISYRYSNVKTEYMEKVRVQENKEGIPIIYVEECKKFLTRMFKYYPEKLRKKKEEPKKCIDNLK